MTEDEYREQMRHAGAHATQGCGFLGIGCLALIAFPFVVAIIAGISKIFGAW